jgi:hypothetical protein
VVGLKLLLLGKTPVPFDSEPWPIEIPGEDEPLNSLEIGNYLNPEFFYYYKFYASCKHAGPPLSGGWTEWPCWILQLITHFDSAIETVRAHRRQPGVTVTAKGPPHGRFIP